MLLKVTGFTDKRLRAVTAVKAYAILAPYLKQASILGSLHDPFSRQPNIKKGIYLESIFTHSECSVSVFVYMEKGGQAWGHTSHG